MSSFMSKPAFVALRESVKKWPEQPGVYRMLDGEQRVLYVGKARELRKRILSYFRASMLTPKQYALMQNTLALEYTLTRNEGEALILENNLIKQFKPRYNILLRDDKSYPYIFVSIKDPYPRLAFYRGARKPNGYYFGPFPSAAAVRETLSLLQKLFRLRLCDDSFFKNRSRPCLQYQIRRCTAPCVQKISRDAYAEDVRRALLFLEGQSHAVITELVERMEHASTDLLYEEAARYRDQIQQLRRVTDAQHVDGPRGDLDLVAAVVEGGVACVQVFFVRGGRTLGNKCFFPKIPADDSVVEVLSAFIPQFYLNRDVPVEILLNHPIEDQVWLGTLLSSQAAKTVVCLSNLRGERARWMQMAEHNAIQMLRARLASQAGYTARLVALKESLALPALPERIECFDVSHTQGSQTYAACVVFGSLGANKSEYRRFAIRDGIPGDDYGALREALGRRYRRIQQGESLKPDLLLIDGGRAQVSTVQQVLDELKVVDLPVVGVAKGEGRKPGLERLFLSGQVEPIILAEDSPALHLIQQIRDEAHRFAITGHRQARRKQQTASVLDEIPGMGPQRRKLLLQQLGGLQQIERAAMEDLAQVKGISKSLAERIYLALHPEQNLNDML